MKKIYRSAFWAVLVFVFVMALLPHPPQLPGSPSDKVQHVAAFVTLAALAAAAYRSTSMLRLLVSLSAFGAVIEFLQAIPALSRNSDPVDWIADTCAATLVLVALWWWRGKQDSLSCFIGFSNGWAAASGPTKGIGQKKVLGRKAPSLLTGEERLEARSRFLRQVRVRLPKNQNPAAHFCPPSTHCEPSQPIRLPLFRRIASPFAK